MSAQVLAKGQNAPLATQNIRATLSWPVGAGVPDVDISALLTTSTGKVRSDADFVFYNQPQHSSGAVRHAGKSTANGQSADHVEFDLARVEPQIETIAVAASSDRGTFGQVQGLTLHFYDIATNAELLTFVLAGEGSETAIIAGELYRRQGAWKFRAVSQGYSSGLAGLATDYGISVDDDPAPAPQVAPPPPPQVQTPQPPLPPPTQDGWPQPPPPPAQGGWPQPPPPPAQGGWPQQPPPPAPAAPAVGGATAAPVNLDKGRVSLAKRQSVSLVKTGAPRLTRVRMGLGWDPAPGARNVDLDASVIAFDPTGKDLGKVWFMHKTEFNGAIRHSGDNLTGQGEGDDEVIYVELGQLPPNVTALAFTINSFQGQNFTDIARAFCRLVDDTSNAELVRFDLSDSKPETGVLMCALYRQPDNTWVMQAIAEFHKGKTVKAMVDFSAQQLGLCR